MQVFLPSDHGLHAPEWYLADGVVRSCPEGPGRAERILAEVVKHGHVVVRVEDGRTEAELEAAVGRVHDAGYLEYLRTIHAVWAAEFAAGGGEDVLPDTFVRRMPGMRRPKKPAAQAGYYCFDMAAPILVGTWRAAWSAARAAVAGARAVLAGGEAYALCRPPGHHAGRDYCGGFCYLNNAALAAQLWVDRGMRRVAILDVDYHHGNGTQDIFYARRDVLFVSIHAEPDTQYPYFWGYAQERGEGEGEGFNVNLPLKRGASAAEWFAALAAAGERIAHFAAEGIIISLGVDTYEKDDVGDFRLSLADFSRLGRELRKMAGGRPMLIVQEGGYRLEAIGGCVAEVLGGASPGAAQTMGR